MHDFLLIPHDRRQRIAARLASGESVSAGDLAREFGVSEDAIRRDLRALAAEGRCRRVYGGALPVSAAGAPMALRRTEALPRKRALALAALPLIRPGMTVFLDTGSTNLHLARALPRVAGLRIVTNSVPAAAALAGRDDLALYVIGGAVDPATGGCADTRALAELARLRFDLAFLGACALSLPHGFAGFDAGEVDFKRAVLGVSAAAAVLLTNDKIGTSAPFAIAAAGAVDHAVLEHDAPATAVAALAAAGVAVRAAAPPQD